ncbi:CPBP family intramembrane metalloprotease [Rubrobacter marinus]|uniref:CPBP family intramembrane metalloprotease n=1 Tax=Rubrobacter marinus TaxID=2653852 RepID=A0A6G8PXV2_9ACTN|nr:type II CAAX endopeptidase family protein [Rubrobacter marinus]QIN78998.1 CPBP family intramembrane metalloprotease [Rubrobacter marinus]
MLTVREVVRRRPVAWFFAVSFVLNVAVIATLLFSGAGGTLETAIEAVWGGQQRTDFVSALRLAVEAPQAIPGIVLSILQPLTPDIAAFAVAGIAFGLGGIGGVVALVRRYRFWSVDVGRRRGLRVWGLMLLSFLAMSLSTAALNHLFAPPGSFEWVRTPLLSWAFPLALLASIFLDIGGVTEETGWRGFAQPLLQERMTPLAASSIVGLLWGVWHLPARPDILTGAYGMWGGVTLLAILVARFLFLSVVMAYFYNRVGGSTIIAIAMHGLHNDSVFLQGRIDAEGLGPYMTSELTLLAPILVVACVLLVASGRRLGLRSTTGKTTG